jgi:hypothetical protein
VPLVDDPLVRPFGLHAGQLAAEWATKPGDSRNRQHAAIDFDLTSARAESMGWPERRPE